MKTNYNDYYKNHYKVAFSESDIEEWCKWFDVQWKLINSKVKIKKGMRILEIGPGFGGFYKYLQDVKGVDYLGLDLDPEIVKFTNNYFHTNDFKFQQFETLNDKSGFDLIVAFEVLEHVENPTGVIDKVHQLLRPGGVFVGTTPYPFTKNIISDQTHISVLHPENWRRIFQLCGFKTTSLHPMSFAPFFWRVSSKLNIRIPFYVFLRGFVSTCLIIAKKSK